MHIHSVIEYTTRLNVSFVVASDPDCSTCIYHNNIGFVPGEFCQVYYMVSKLKDHLKRIIYMYIYIHLYACIYVSSTLFLIASRLLLSLIVSYYTHFYRCTYIYIYINETEH